MSGFFVCSEDNKYKSMISRIQTVRKGWAVGMYEDIMNLEGNAKRVAPYWQG